VKYSYEYFFIYDFNPRFQILATSGKRRVDRGSCAMDHAPRAAVRGSRIKARHP